MDSDHWLENMQCLHPTAILTDALPLRLPCWV
jgi:hypothetical protein